MSVHVQNNDMRWRLGIMKRALFLGGFLLLVSHNNLLWPAGDGGAAGKIPAGAAHAGVTQNGAPPLTGGMVTPGNHHTRAVR